jgi:hypothetical protein
LKATNREIRMQLASGASRIADLPIIVAQDGQGPSPRSGSTSRFSKKPVFAFRHTSFAQVLRQQIDAQRETVAAVTSLSVSKYESSEMAICRQLDRILVVSKIPLKLTGRDLEKDRAEAL